MAAEANKAALQGALQKGNKGTGDGGALSR